MRLVQRLRYHLGCGLIITSTSRWRTSAIGFLNAVEPGTVVPIHRRPTKDESFVILRGKVRVTTHNDDGSIIEDVVLSQESGNYGVGIPKNVWHKLDSLELRVNYFA